MFTKLRIDWIILAIKTRDINSGTKRKYEIKLDITEYLAKIPVGNAKAIINLSNRSTTPSEIPNEWFPLVNLKKRTGDAKLIETPNCFLNFLRNIKEMDT